MEQELQERDERILDLQKVQEESKEEESVLQLAGGNDESLLKIGVDNGDISGLSRGDDIASPAPDSFISKEEQKWNSFLLRISIFVFPPTNNTQSLILSY